MTSLNWKRRVPTDVSLGYYADGAAHRYVAYRYESAWLLQVRRLTGIVGGVNIAQGAPIDTDRSDTLALCKAVAQAYEDAPERDGAQNRMTRAIGAAYDAAAGK